MSDRGARPAVARVMGPDGEPVGAAFLVTPTVLLTAAHVVSLAAGHGREGVERPDGEVFLNFAAAPDQYPRAEVVHWIPPGGASPEDIAGLRLIDPVPDGVTPVPFTDLTAPLGRRVVTLGFPRDAPHGGWGLGRLAGADARDLVQVDTLPDSQFTIEEGFSGTPVWDVEDRAVAGLVVEGWTRGRRSGFMIPTSVLLAAWPWLADQVWPRSPFRGLRSFREGDAEVFFGRDELVARVVRLNRTAPALTMVGPSGIGKSSLLNAGVLPRLRQRAGLVVATVRPSQARTPLRAVALALARAAAPDADAVGRGELVDAFAERLARGLVAEVVDEVLAGRGGERLLLVVDQFEEVFIASAGELAQVAGVLRHSLAPHSRMDLLTALRVDFLGRALQHRDLAELVQDTRLVTVGELSQSELRAAIVEPVRRTRMARYEPGLVDRLLTDVGAAPGVLPLLQFTLAMLWDEQDHGVLTHRAYDALGGIASALAEHAEAIWDGLGRDERLAAARLFGQLLFPVPDSTSFVRRVALRAELDDAQWSVAQRLSTDRARLVVLREQDDGGQTAELAHDALVTHWPRLGELGERDREFREWQEGLRQRIRRNAPPLSGADLRDAVRWQARRGADLSPAERTYLDVSRRDRARRLRRWAAAGVAVVVVAGLVLLRREQEVSRDAADAILRHMSSSDQYARLRTTLRAYRTGATSGTMSQLAREYERYARVDQVLPDDTAEPIVLSGGEPMPSDSASAMAHKVSADGRTLVTTDPQDNVTLWRVDGGRVTGRPLGQTASRVTISRDGRYVAYLQSPISRLALDGPKTSCQAEGIGHCVYLYDSVTRRTRLLGTVVSSPFAQVPVVRFDPTARVVAVLFGLADPPYRQRLVTWEVATGREVDDVILPGGDMASADDLWLAPGGRRLLVEVAMPMFPRGRLFHGVVASVDLTGEPVLVPLAQGVARDQLAVSGDGGRVAALVPLDPLHPEREKKLVVWDVTTGGEVMEMPGVPERQALGQIALDLHGDRVFLTAFIDDDVSVRRVADTTAQPVTLHADGWENVLPLGGDENTPLLLVHDNVVGLVLPRRGEPAPMRRLAEPPPDTPIHGGAHEEWLDELSAMLVTDVQVPGEVKDLPAGAYAGPLRTG